METQQQDINRHALETLVRFAELGNICSELDKGRVTEIGRDAVRFAKIDDNSRADWLKKSETAMDAALQVVEKKTKPWPGASNVKYPLITVAALQFHARAYPAIIQGNKVVKAQVTGADQDGEKSKQGERVADHMNYQLLDENPEWEEEFDKLLLALPIEGCEFKKTYYSPSRGYNVSEWIRPNDLIVNAKAKSLETCPRITHRVWFYPYEISEKQQLGLWNEDVNLQISQDDLDQETLQEFYEQHTFLDLNNDGHKEPYIVTVHRKSEEVVRIAPRYEIENVLVNQSGVITKIPPIKMFTKYELFPSPDGCFYGLGFGQLVGPLADSVDTNINQLIDAGTLANTPGGFIRDGVSIDGRRSTVTFKQGEFKRVKLGAAGTFTDAIFQFKFPEPSLVLFQLLGFLVQAAKEITSVQNIMTGGAVPENQAATTTMVQVEQGLKVFSAIYKRIYRSLKKEFQLLFKLNARYLQPEQYFTVLDNGEQGVITLSDYRDDGTNIQPVADPQLATSLLAYAKAQMLLSQKNDPGLNADEINKFFLEALEVPSVDRFVVPQDKRQQGPDPLLVLEAMKAASKHSLDQATALNRIADSIKKLAEAEGIEIGPQLEFYKAQLDVLHKEWGAHGYNQGRGLPVEAGQGNQGVV